MDVSLVLKTASIYTTLLLSTATKVYTRQEKEKIHISTPFGGHREERLIRQLMHEASNRCVYYLEGDFGICSCLIFLENYLMVIGPYRAKTLQKSELDTYRKMSADKAEEFLKFHSTFPLVSPENVEAAAKAPFISIYGNSMDVAEQHIQTREFEKGAAPTLEFAPEHVNMDLAAIRTMNSLSLLSALCEGNYVASVNIYESIMQTKKNPFMKTTAIEGLTSLRVLLSMALNTMAVPANAAYPLMREFKLKARNIRNKEDANKLSVGAIAQVCRLIRQQTGSKYSATVRAAIDYIHSNLSFPLSVRDIAEEVHMTDSAFTRKFRQEMGVTPTEYITRERMRQAADLLLFTNLDIRHICTQVGMMDANYFARCFKKEYGLSPTVYRKRGQKD